MLCIGCPGFADRLVPFPQLLTFPVDHERDGVELALLSEAVSLTLYQTVLGLHDKFAKDHILRSFSDPRYSHRVFWFYFTHRPFANCRQREFDSSLPHLHACAVDDEFDTMPYPSCSSSDRSEPLCRKTFPQRRQNSRRTVCKCSRS